MVAERARADIGQLYDSRTRRGQPRPAEGQQDQVAGDLKQAGGKAEDAVNDLENR